MLAIDNEVINKRIRIKFSIPLIALTAGCCLVVLIFYIFLFNRELYNAMYNNVDVAAMVTEHEIENLKANGRAAAMGISNDPVLIEAVANNDREIIRRTANTLRTIAQVDYCTILDKDGNVITRTHEPEIFGDSLLHLPHVKNASEGIRASVVAQGVTIDLGVYSGAPILDDEKNIIGIVSLGFRLSNPKYVNGLKTITMCEISIFSCGNRIATTIDEKDDPYSTEMKLPDYISDMVLAGGSYSDRIKIAGQETIAKYMPIYGAENKAVGMVGIGYYTKDDNNKLLLFITIGLLITLGVISICILLARFILKIVERRLGEMMNEVRKADEMVRSVTEEKNTLANIKNIMNGLDVMIYVTDPKTNDILFINDRMKTHYGIEGDPVGKKCYKILQKDQNEKCGFCPCFRLDKEPDNPVVWNEHSSLTNCIYRNVDRYIKWQNGQTVHIQHSVDITELITAKETAELSNRSKGYFLAQMSHEIRTPMNAILGISEIQLRKDELSEDAKDGYRKINESGNLLLNIINDILDFSKIDAGKLEIVCEKYDIPNLINDTIQLKRLRFENKPIKFIIKLDENTPRELMGDELRIRQIMYNLLSNAFKYTEKGEVELSVCSEAGKKDDTVMLAIRVRDTGQGMTESQVLRIFDEYSRFNMDTNRSISGTGLGMSITKRLIDMMDGEIFVESKQGEGSLFTVLLPQKSCAAAACGSEAAKDLRKFNFRNMSMQKRPEIVLEYMPYGKVLVVDDVESNLLVAKGLLIPYGVQIDTAKSGFEAIEKIKTNNNYDIVFMDHMMPGMDGIKTTEVLRNMGYIHPIVALTANALIGQEEMFLANGFNGFISKPIDSRELNKLLIGLIQNKKFKEDMGQFNVSSVPDSSEIAAAAVMDIKNAVAVLKDLLSKINAGGIKAANMELFTTTVHGMKSALANIKEELLSNIALKLERAASDKNETVISAETPEFINALLQLMEKMEQSKIKDNKEIPFDNSPDDLIFLRDKLKIIKEACDKLNIKDAKTTLADLKKKTWTYRINEMLDEITMLILRGEYIKVDAVISNANKIMNPEREK